ncbi:MAG: putative capsid protein [Circoviridae sp.]|nr:MAG: putative capsid protein [Circoviridae sp.]
MLKKLHVDIYSDPDIYGDLATVLPRSLRRMSQKKNMPKRKRSGGRFGKRKRRRRNRQTRGIRTIVPVSRFSPIPKSSRVTLKYNECIGYTTDTTGLMQYDVFRANSIYDPYYPVGGHQPYGHDQMALFYDHYRVLNSSIKVVWEQRVIGLSGASTSIFCGASLQDSSTNEFTTVPFAIESNRVHWGLIKPDPLGKCTTKSRFNAKTFFRNQNTSTTTMAQVGANPSEQAYFILQYGNHCGISGQAIAIIANITVYYDVVFSEPKAVGQS